MYMNVKELNEQQLEQLKTKVFYDFNDNETEFIQHIIQTLETEDFACVFENLETAECWTDISNETIYKLYGGISFVEEDFCCRNNERQKVYEIAVFNNEDIIAIAEYKKLQDLWKALPFAIKKYNDCTHIELSTQEQEDGENQNTYTFGTIDIKEFVRGELK